MMQTLNCSSKTEQILARYRPIAPRPSDHDLTENNPNSDPSCMPQNIRDSPYLRTVWPQLQARPTRTRKRGRTSVGPALPCKRSKPNYSTPPNNTSSSLITCPTQNNNQVPIEKNLLQKLQGQEIRNKDPFLFTPKPIRLVSSSIVVQPNTTISGPAVMMHGPTKADEIEKGMESETLPIVISDSNNKVRLANSAYKRLVGQPECNWLDSMATCNRICGEVMLKIPESVGNDLVSSSKGVFCLVVIEWGNNEYKSSITTSGEAVRLCCESRDYKFAWRFHTQGALAPPPPNL